MSSGLAADDADQHGFAYRFGWGAEGLSALAPACAVIVIVDVLRFTSAVSAAVERGSIVFPYRWNDRSAAEYAAECDAQLAGFREDGGPSLSPTDLLAAPTGSRIVLPSPNGSTLAFEARAAGARNVLAGCFRNTGPTAELARTLAGGDAVGVIAAGERWPGDQRPLRPCVEDLLGAGALLAALDPSASVSQPGCSPEASAARAAFAEARPLLAETLRACTSGRECIRRGWADDVETAAEYNVTDTAAQLVDDAFLGT